MLKNDEIYPSDEKGWWLVFLRWIRRWWKGNGRNKKRAIKALHPQRKNNLLNLRWYGPEPWCPGRIRQPWFLPSFAPDGFRAPEGWFSARINEKYVPLNQLQKSAGDLLLGWSFCWDKSIKARSLMGMQINIVVLTVFQLRTPDLLLCLTIQHLLSLYSVQWQYE